MTQYLVRWGGGGVAGGSPVLISDWGSPAIHPILSGSWKKGKTKDGESGSTVVARTHLQSWGDRQQVCLEPCVWTDPAAWWGLPECWGALLHRGATNCSKGWQRTESSVCGVEVVKSESSNYVIDHFHSEINAGNVKRWAELCFKGVICPCFSF